ncbi:TraR/DksA family transcriptional regulator [Bdellovibrio sp. SKB1291214]|uniref:TraR/DksA family transcriptional regulator n=1 Tax=Bdellovibrio sp. SKB1291214 TaxID=1732569 RepID=UPI000B518613|nr:TraR/DksA family transcriptional regulator [Bdellovibrio sp. SKB1291214]UYL10588.1 TraR/DksA family transcriptional regulator [Bdellovibrio sp. SKB1291214]
MKNPITENIVTECRRKLILTKQDILNRFRTAQLEFTHSEKTGDEGDISVAHIEEHTFLVSQERMRNQLLEIEMALSRIESGTYGLCEETEEPIEADRLLAIPWTRLSIEGAEMREAVSRKFAR